MDFYDRRSLRLKAFDYSGGWFFITTCIKDRKPILGGPGASAIQLTTAGKIVEEEWLRTARLRPGIHLDAYVVMPNHFHAVLSLPGAQAGVGVLGQVMAQFKAASSRRINALANRQGEPVWQRGYYDHVVRDDRDLERIRRYITNNPIKWELDRENMERAGENEDEGIWF